MFGSENSRRNALAMSIGWWYLRRMIRKRGTAAVAGLVAGEGLSFAPQPRKRHLLRWIVLLGVARRRRVLVVAPAAGGGGDDWGDWTPVVPDATADRRAAAPMPEPAPEPVAT